MIRLTDADQLGPAIAEVRHIYDISQRALAAESGCRQSQISNWELCATRPNLDSLIRIANALGFDLALIPREDA